jgi:DNA topoisomerase IA
MRIVKALQTEAKGADYLVLWLDCDREGGACVQAADAFLSGQFV